MIEVTTIRYLSTALEVPVYAERPENPDPSYVLIERTASSKHDQISTATLAVQCYAPSMLSAATLCEEVLRAMEDFDVLPEISSCDLNSAYNFSDPETREYRYQAVFDLVYYNN